MRQRFISVSLLLLAVNGIAIFFYQPALWGLLLLLPVILLGIFDILQRKHTVWRNFPLLGHTRWLMEDLRPKIRQYFVESDLGGAPVNRVFRTVVYQRCKKQMDTVPYGTKFDVYRVGYEWIGHFPGRQKPGRN